MATKAQKIRDYFRKHPKADALETSKQFECTMSHIYGLRKQALSKNGQVRSRQKPGAKIIKNGMQIRISVPDNGVAIQMDNYNNMVGTLLISETGINFVPPNAKKRAEHEMTWDILTTLLHSGAFG